MEILKVRQDKTNSGKPRLAVIQARINPSAIAAEQVRMRKIADRAGVSMRFISPLDSTDRFPWDKKRAITGEFDGALLMGTSDVDHTRPTKLNEIYYDTVTPHVREFLSTEFPTMAVCFGHQMVAMTAGGEVQRNRPQGELGTAEIKFTEGPVGDLAEGIDEPVRVLFGHKDSVSRPPNDAEVHGETERDTHSVLWYGANIVTFQGHPEIEDPNLAHEMLKASKFSPLGPYEQTYPIEKPSTSSTIVVNFLEKVKT